MKNQLTAIGRIALVLTEVEVKSSVDKNNVPYEYAVCRFKSIDIWNHKQYRRTMFQQPIKDATGVVTGYGWAGLNIEAIKATINKVAVGPFATAVEVDEFTIDKFPAKKTTVVVLPMEATSQAEFDSFCARINKSLNKYRTMVAAEAEAPQTDEAVAASITDARS